MSYWQVAHWNACVCLHMTLSDFSFLCIHTNTWHYLGLSSLLFVQSWVVSFENIYINPKKYTQHIYIHTYVHTCNKDDQIIRGWQLESEGYEATQGRLTQGLKWGKVAGKWYNSFKIKTLKGKNRKEKQNRNFRIHSPVTSKQKF